MKQVKNNRNIYVGGPWRKEECDRNCHARETGLLYKRVDNKPCCVGQLGSAQMVSGIRWKGTLLIKSSKRLDLDETAIWLEQLTVSNYSSSLCRL